jgi:hypothetical protein
VNKNNNNMILSRYSNLKLNMGCDYYINKSLYIYDFNNKLLSNINLEHSIGYYSYFKDEDEEDYDYNEYKKKILKLNMKPIVIYINNTFSKSFFEEKYKKIIDYELNIKNKKWNDINKILKKEERYER